MALPVKKEGDAIQTYDRKVEKTAAQLGKKGSTATDRELVSKFSTQVREQAKELSDYMVERATVKHG